eukprot:scaffold15697_cov40-Cyclotella_meneghiniana.AAC.13
MQAETGVPTVEALMACDSKTEASKEDNPRWKQAMSGPFKEEYWKDAIKEIESLELESMDVWKRSNSGRHVPHNHDMAKNHTLAS